MTVAVYNFIISNTGAYGRLWAATFEVLLQDEVGGNATTDGVSFVISAPVNANSGYTFGPLQFDFYKNGAQATQIALGVISASGLASEGSQAYLAAQTDLNSISGTRSGPSTATQTLLTSAMGTSGGQAYLLQQSAISLNAYIANAKSLIASTPYKDNDAIVVLASDYANQYGSIQNNSAMARLLSGGSVNISNQPFNLQLNSADPVPNLVQFLLSTKYAAKTAYNFQRGVDDAGRAVTQDAVVNRINNALLLISANGISGINLGTYYFTGPVGADNSSAFLYQLNSTGQVPKITIDPVDGDGDISYESGETYTLPDTQIAIKVGTGGEMPGMVDVTQYGIATISSLQGGSSVVVGANASVTMSPNGASGGFLLDFGNDATGHDVTVQVDAAGNLTYVKNGQNIASANAGSTFIASANYLINFAKGQISSIAQAQDGNVLFGLTANANGTSAIEFNPANGSLIVQVPGPGGKSVPISFATKAWSSVSVTGGVITDLFGDPFGTLSLDTNTGDISVSGLASNANIDFGSLSGTIALTGDDANTDVLSIGTETLIATAHTDNLVGGTGTETLIVNGATESLIASSGSDRLTWTSDGTTLAGGEGNDTLIAGSTDDVLIGGSGQDSFIINPGTEVKGIQAGDIISLKSTAIPAMQMVMALAAEIQGLVEDNDTVELGAAVRAFVLGYQRTYGGQDATADQLMVNLINTNWSVFSSAPMLTNLLYIIASGAVPGANYDNTLNQISNFLHSINSGSLTEAQLENGSGYVIVDGEGNVSISNQLPTSTAGAASVTDINGVVIPSSLSDASHRVIASTTEEYSFFESQVGWTSNGAFTDLQVGNNTLTAVTYNVFDSNGNILKSLNIALPETQATGNAPNARISNGADGVDGFLLAEEVVADPSQDSAVFTLNFYNQDGALIKTENVGYYNVTPGVDDYVEVGGVAPTSIGYAVSFNEYHFNSGDPASSTNTYYVKFYDHDGNILSTIPLAGPNNTAYPSYAGAILQGDGVGGVLSSTAVGAGFFIQRYSSSGKIIGNGWNISIPAHYILTSTCGLQDGGIVCALYNGYSTPANVEVIRFNSDGSVNGQFSVPAVGDLSFQANFAQVSISQGDGFSLSISDKIFYYDSKNHLINQIYSPIGEVDNNGLITPSGAVLDDNSLGSVMATTNNYVAIPLKNLQSALNAEADPTSTTPQTYAAGQGSPNIKLNAGNDTVLYDATSGAGQASNITISGGGGSNTINITDSRAFAYFTISSSQNNMQIGVSDSGSITLKNQYNDDGGYSGAAAGHVVVDNYETIDLKSIHINADGSESIVASAAGQTLFGDAGVDILSDPYGNGTMTGGSGSETFIGGVGDTIYTGQGANTVIAGTGDTILGGSAAYYYSRGVGKVIISGDGAGFLHFGAGIAASDVTLTPVPLVNFYGPQGEALEISDGVAGDEIIIDQQLTNQKSGLSGIVFADGTTMSLVGLALTMPPGQSLLWGGRGADTLIATPGVETLLGNSVQDTFIGSQGTETLDGSGPMKNFGPIGGHDTFIFGQGSATALGTGGTDVFSYAAGDGSASIIEYGGSNTLELGAGIDRSAITLTKSGQDLLISDGVSGDQITIVGQFAGNPEVGLIVFADQSTMSLAAPPLTMPAGQTVLMGTPYNDSLVATPGNETLLGEGGNDTYIGSSGTELLSADGDSGNNDFIIGSGQATVIGGSGNDKFSYSAGDGALTISDEGGTNTLVLGPGLSASQISLSAAGNNLLISDGTAGDQIVIKGQLQPSGNRIIPKFEIMFADQSTMSLNGIALTMPPGSSTLNGSAGNDTLIATPGSEELLGNGGNDTFIGSTGTDYLVANVSDGSTNVFIAGIGVTDVQVSSGVNFYSFAQGDGKETIQGTGGAGTLILGQGLTAANVSVSLVGKDIIVTDGTAGDTVDISNEYANTPYVQTVIYGDGTTMSLFQGWNIVATGDGYWTGSGQGDTLVGGVGNETLSETSGGNTFLAGQGRETLQGSGGSNIYSYAAGDGAITLEQNGGNGTLILGGALTESNISFKQFNKDLLILDGSAGDLVDLYSQEQSDSGFQIQTLQFSDGTFLNLAGVIPSILGAVGNGSWTGASGANQTLVGGVGTETLIGGTGAAADTFIAGQGAETLEGTGGNDVYSYAQGDGAVSIIENGGSNVLVLGNSLNLSNISVSVSGNDLVITDGVSGDRIDIVNELAGNTANLVQTLQFSDGSTKNLLLGSVFTAPNGSVTLNGSAFNDTMIGSTGNQTLNGGGGSDTFLGGTGAQLFSGTGSGNNLFVAAVGSTTAFGGTGNDTYSYSAGDGQLLINDAGGTNTLVLGQGLTQSSVTFTGSGNDLLITDGKTGDQIDIQNQLGATSAVQTLVFGDGSTISLNGLQLGGSSTPSSIINGTPGNDTLVALPGKETLNGNGGNDTFIGASGTETLNAAGGGNDVFIIGQGLTTAIGGSGNDIYSYARGNGQLVIQDSAGSNTLKFGPGVSASDLTFSGAGTDLLITDGTAGDQVIVKGALGGTTPVQTAMFANGSSMSLAGVPINTIPGNASLNGTAGSDTLFASSGSETLTGNGGNDTFVGASGTDVMYGNQGGGSNVFIAGQGTTTAYGGTGNDTYSYVSGDGSLVMSDSGGANTLRLGAGLTSANVTLTISGTNVLISDGVTGDTITDLNRSVQTLVYADGSTTSLLIGGVVTGSGNGSFAGGQWNDTLTGGTGTETLNGNGGADTIIAGIGPETLFGGNGNDTYSYAQGDGSDTIGDGGGTNTLKLSSGLTLANVVLTRSGNDLLITDGTAGDQIRIANQFYSGNVYNSLGIVAYRVQTLLFGDGTTLDLTGALPIKTNGNGVWSAATNLGDTYLIGTGSETLFGGSGNDVYSYTQGDGSDTIGDGGGTNTLKLSSSLTLANVVFTRSGNDLLISDGTAGDQIRIANQFYSGNVYNPLGIVAYRVQTLVFGDGTTFDLTGALPIKTSGNGAWSAATNLGDTYLVGAGSETLLGGSGGDIYSYTQGDGSDTIADAGGANTLKLSSSLTLANVVFTRSGNDLLISDGTAGDQIRIANQFYSGNVYNPLGIVAYQVQTLVFGDGTTLNLAGGMPFKATGSGSWIGSSGADTLIGGSGTETLNGGGGNDTFIAGIGPETLIGGSGNAIYSYAQGDGIDTIANLGGTDTLVLSSSLTLANVVFTRSGNDLLLTDGTAGDQIRIANQFSSGSYYGGLGIYTYQVQTLKFGDGSTINLTGGLPFQASGNGSWIGSSGADTLIGGSGTETLNGGGGNDTFIAGVGPEVLIGGSGNAAYSYAQGDGIDTIANLGGTDTLVLSSSLTLANVVFTRSGNDLLLTDGTAGDQIRIANQFSSGSYYGGLGVYTYQVQTLKFGDGSTMNLTGGLPFQASGNGSWIGSSGADTLIGGSGTETLNGGGGNDTFIAGVGPEVLIGGSGNAAYSYAQGDGIDTIANLGGTDTLVLSSSLTLANVVFTRSGNDLLLTDGTAGDQIRIANQFSSGSYYGGLGIYTYQVQTLKFGDGSTMNLTGGLPFQASGNGSWIGSSNADTLIGGSGTETLNGGGGNDTFIAGVGPEVLIGGSGNAAYSYAQGDGIDTIANLGGTDTLVLSSSLTLANVVFTRSGNDLLLTDGTAGDQIRIANQFSSGSYYGGLGIYTYQVQTLKFGDGSTINLTGGLAFKASGNGSWIGSSNADTLIGGSGTETLNGGGGNDTFIAGVGPEVLIGSGNAIYSYAQGDGSDTIANLGGTDTLVLSSSLTLANVQFNRSGNDLIITDGTAGDQIRIANQYSSGSYYGGVGTSAYQVQTLVFGDGTTLSLTGGLPIRGNGSGAWSGSGLGDTFIAGVGTETITEGSGNDIYSYAAGDGRLNISQSGGKGTLYLGGVNRGSVSLSISGNDLLISDGTTGDLIDLQNQASSFSVQTAVFSDGSTMGLTGLTLTAAPTASLLTGTGWNDTLIASTGSQTLNGNGGNDTFIGGSGTESLVGTQGNGSNVFIVGQGATTAFGGAGNDTYSYAAGDGSLVVSDTGGSNTLLLGGSLTSGSITFTASGSDLLIADGTAGDQITLKNQLTSSPQFQSIIFASGGSLSLKGLALTTPASGAVLNGTVGNDTLMATAGTETLNGIGGGDTFVGSTGTEVLLGNQGNGNNVFIIGQGTTTAYGGTGNDVYSYAAGSGALLIVDGGGTNTLKLGGGLAAANLSFTASGSDLLISDGTSGDQIDIRNQLTTGVALQSLVFADGTTQSLTGLALSSTTGSILNGSAGNDTLVAQSGNETIFGNGGNDTLVGGTGLDVLNGTAGAGKDLFVAGQGGTTAYGGTGNDTYSYVSGDGAFVVNDSGGTNVLVLGTGITAANLQFTASGSDLLISDGTSGDQVDIRNQLSSGQVIQTVSFAGGGTMSLEGVALTTPAGATNLNGTAGSDTLFASSGSETLTGNGGNDTFVGASGTDVMYGNQGGGSNVFIAGQGTTTAYGGTGNDTYSYVSGDGSLVMSDSGGANTLRLGAGLTSANVTLTISGTNVLISDGVTGDTITDLNRSVQTLVYADGSTTSLLIGGVVTGSGNGSFAGGQWNDTLTGGTGTETLNGNGGADTIIAGIGPETLFGGNGNDTYSYAQGDGSDTIGDGGGTNTLKLSSGLTLANVVLTRSGNDLLITDGTAGDQIRIANQFSPGGYFSPFGDYPYSIQTLMFGDGTTLNLVGGLPIKTNGNGNWSGTNLGDTYLIGTGSETLFGGSGNEIYSYTQGDGSDTIADGGGSNTLKLSSSLTLSNIVFTRSGNDLLITDGTAGDQIRIANQFSPGGYYNPLGDYPYSIQTLIFGDGTTLNLAGGLPIKTSGNGSWIGSSNADTLIGGSGTETLNGGGGNDTFIAGIGPETLIGGSGNATYSYGQGSGTDTIVNLGGTDTLALSSSLTLANVVLTRSGNDLLITDGTAGDQIRIANQFNSGGYYNPVSTYTYQIQTLIFGDGTTLNLTGGLPIKTGGNGAWTGSSQGDTYLVGAGSETLLSGSGNDTYSYVQGDGSDTIADGGGTNTLKLSSSLTLANVVFTRSGNDLLITDGTAGDQIRLANQFNPGGYYSGLGIYTNPVQTLVFGDGTTLSLMGGLAFKASGNGSWIGSSNADTLIGGNGTETLNGGGGNDTFIAGVGPEMLIGGSGNAIYSYAQGDGIDTIVNLGGTDTLVLSSGLTSANVVLTRSGNDLVITDGSAGDQIRIANQFGSGSYYGGVGTYTYQAQTLQFGDGTTLNLTGGLAFKASGNGSWIGSSNADTLIGGSGTETLNGGGGNDTFIAGVGPEMLIGGSGNAIYSYAQGDGIDTIVNLGGTDTLVLSSSLTSANVVLTRSGNDLVITDGTAGDQIRIANQFGSGSYYGGVGTYTYQAQTLQFGDGTTLNLTGGLAFKASGNGSWIGSSNADTLIGGSGTETLNGGGGNDTFIAGVGPEMLIGSGNAIYSYAQGDGSDTIANLGGTDTLVLSSSLTLANVVLSRSGNDLLITDGTVGDQIRIANQYSSGSYYGGVGTNTYLVQTLVFGDGTTFNLTGGLTIKASGTGAWSGSGLGDTFIAGVGTETITEGSGNDIYSYAAGDGRLNISQSGGKGTLYLGGVNRGSVSLSISGNDLLINDGTTGDLIDLQNQASSFSVQTAVFSDGSTMGLTGLTLTAAPTASLLTGTGWNDTLTASTGNQTLNGNGGNDTFIGGAGTESLVGTQGNGSNVFIVGQGATTAFGGSGNDTYSYAAGDGSLVVSDTGGSNTLLLGGSLTSGSITFTASGSDLLIADGTAGDQITLKNQLTAQNPVQILRFANGTSISLLGLSLSVPNGSSLLNGTSANDTLTATVGSQTLIGNGGNDTFVAGRGSTTAYGGTGNDLYSYVAGDGTLVINDSGGLNTLRLGTGLTASSLTLTTSGNDLLITDGTSGDQIVIQSQLTSRNVVQTIQFADGSTMNLEGVALTGSQLPNVLNGTSGNDTLLAIPGSETVYGFGGNDTFIGSQGAEVLYGNYLGSSNVFIVGKGATTAYGGYGNDVYSYAAGDGSLVINDPAGSNTLVMANGITSSNLTFTLSGSDLLISDGTSGDSIDVVDHGVQVIQFADGSTSSLLIGTALTAQAGTGVLSGTQWNDTLTASNGTQTLNGNGGNDTFIAGTGSDTFNGGSGNDTYIVAPGGGTDVINETGGTNTLIFGGGIARDQLWFTQSGNNLDISVIGTSQQIVVQNWYSGTANQVQQIEVAGTGSILANTQVANMVNAMAGLTPPPAGQTTLSPDQANQLEPVIAANWH